MNPLRQPRTGITLWPLTSDQIRHALRQEADSLGSQKALALAIGCSAAYLNDFLNGKRDPGKKILDYCELERVVRYDMTNGRSFSAQR